MFLRTHEGEIRRLKSLEDQAKAGGGQKALEKQRANGRLTARERIDALLDPDSFVEFNMLADHQCYNFNMQDKKIPGDGVVTGYGTVDGRLVFVYSQDATNWVGPWGRCTVKKSAMP